MSTQRHHKDPFPMRVVTCIRCDNDAHTTREHDEADEFDPRQPHGESGLFQHEPGAPCVVCDRRPGDGVWPPALRSTPAAPQSIRDALYDLRTHSHQPPNGADMPIEYVAFRDVEDLLSRAALDAPAPQSLRDALTNIIEEAEEVTIHQHGNPVSVLQSVVIDARNARAALDAPALTVDNLLGALEKHDRNRWGDPQGCIAIRIADLPAILRALGEGAGE